MPTRSLWEKPRVFGRRSEGFCRGAYRRLYRQASALSLLRAHQWHEKRFSPGRLHERRPVCHQGMPESVRILVVVAMYRTGWEAADRRGGGGVRVFPREKNYFGMRTSPADKEYAKALFRVIAPYRKSWSSQATIDAALRTTSFWVRPPGVGASSCSWAGVGLAVRYGRGAQRTQSGGRLRPHYQPRSRSWYRRSSRDCFRF